MKLKNSINRRSFIKGAATATALSLTGCTPDKNKNESNGSSAKKTGGSMTYRTNPKTGEKVSLLGYGCMRFPTANPQEKGSAIDQTEVNRLIDYALAHGVNYFDTSPVYHGGKSEEATALALNRHPRDSYFIATKLSNFDPSTWPREKSIEMYHNSLKTFKTDHIDYMLLHAIGGTSDGYDAMETFNARFIDNGILDFLLAEREAGRIKNLGFSYHGDIAVFDHLLANHDKYKWDFVQIQLNYVDWDHAHEINEVNTNASYLYDELKKRGIPAVIMEPLLGGRLATLSDELVSRMKQKRPDDSVATWAFRYAGTPEGVLTVLSGMTYMDHLTDNLAAYSPLEPITADEDKMLMEIAKRYVSYPLVPCTGCRYCVPCPVGIEIPEILQHYNKCVNEGNIVEDNRDPSYAAARRAFLIGYDRSVTASGQADHCIQCGMCVTKCPQNINIPERLADIDQIVETLKRTKA